MPTDTRLDPPQWGSCGTTPGRSCSAHTRCSWCRPARSWWGYETVAATRSRRSRPGIVFGFLAGRCRCVGDQRHRGRQLRGVSGHGRRRPSHQRRRHVCATSFSDHSTAGSHRHLPGRDADSPVDKPVRTGYGPVPSHQTTGNFGVALIRRRSWRTNSHARWLGTPDEPATRRVSAQWTHRMPSVKTRDLRCRTDYPGVASSARV